jgi:SAM-dependent methyltransferase
MPEFDPAAYGEAIADVYDEWPGTPPSAAATVEFLAALAPGGRALELGIGTGRVALPLAERGLEVRGLDVSEAMVARLRAKPGGDAIAVTIGDMADVPVDGEFDLVYVVFNTFFGLTTQEAQVRCFANVAQRLRPGGTFLLEAFVPDLARFDRGQRINTEVIQRELVQIAVARHFAAEQHVVGQHVQLRPDGSIRFFPVEIRYAWPSELDLMARLAGLRLRDRFAGWGREPFGDSSGQHVSVYERSS